MIHVALLLAITATAAASPIQSVSAPLEVIDITELAELVPALTGADGNKPFPGCRGGTLEGCPGTPNCTVHYIEQSIDHFNWAPPLGDAATTTYKMRYFMNDQWWATNADGTRGPIFFYFGNEDNVELYVNHTGLMWENAAEFGALLIFAEHRHYGDSVPYKAGTTGCMNFLTTEQAMADFAYLIEHLRSNLTATKSPIIGFGGSYGGMIASWFRIHYPNAVDGVIAASAPIWSFTGLEPPYDPNTFDQIVTVDASLAGGASDACRDNLKAAWPRILAAGTTEAGRATLSKTFRTCSPVRAADRFTNDPYALVQFAAGVWGTMAMGNYPYSSSYLLHGLATLPPWPVRTACLPLNANFRTDADLFTAVVAAASYVHDPNGDLPCFNITGQPSSTTHAKRARQPKMTSTLGGPVHAEASETASCYGNWGYQWCTEMVQPFTEGTDKDMFFCPNGTYMPAENCTNWDFEGQSAGCKQQWGVTPRKEWAKVILGGKRIQDATNIVFSNGKQDPWHGGGIMANVSDTVVSVVIPNGAHHIDLMFSDPGDVGYPDIAQARETEVAWMHRWVKETYERYGVTGTLEQQDVTAE
jgi:lysosomal Pro-X carboxypeptidase